MWGEQKHEFIGQNNIYQNIGYWVISPIMEIKLIIHRIKHRFRKRLTYFISHEIFISINILHFKLEFRPKIYNQSSKK